MLHSVEWDEKLIECENVIKNLNVSVRINLKILAAFASRNWESKRGEKKQPGNVICISRGDILSLLLQLYCFTNLNCNTVPWQGSVPSYCAVHSDDSLEFAIKAKIPGVQYLALTEIVTEGRALKVQKWQAWLRLEPKLFELLYSTHTMRATKGGALSFRNSCHQTTWPSGSLNFLKVSVCPLRNLL